VTNAQVESLYLETLEFGAAPAQVESFYLEVLGRAAGAPAQVESFYLEMLVNVPGISTLSPLATPSASTTGASTSAANALDGDPTTDWKSSGAVSGEWIKQVFSVTKEVSSYVLAATATISQAPKTWKLQGSNDGSSWTDVDTKTNQSAWNARESREYALAAGYTFQQWRILFTAAQSDPTTVGISEFQLFPPIVAPGGGASTATSIGLGALPV
jgi:hypothetical protein